MGYSRARWTLIYEKNLKSKISCQTPFKIFTLHNAHAYSEMQSENMEIITDLTVFQFKKEWLTKCLNTRDLTVRMLNFSFFGLYLYSTTNKH